MCCNGMRLHMFAVCFKQNVDFGLITVIIVVPIRSERRLLHQRSCADSDGQKNL